MLQVIEEPPADLPVRIEDGCWTWTAQLTPDGYGRRSKNPKSAHRYVYERLVGPIPEGLQIDHLCRNRACVNPAHMEPVTNWENTLRGENFIAKQVKGNTCPKGHPYDAVYVGPSYTRRYCLRCARESGAARALRWRNAARAAGRKVR